MPSAAAHVAATPSAIRMEDWELPSGSLQGLQRRGAEFARLAELHGALRRSCQELLRLARRDFSTVERIPPEQCKLSEGSRSPSKFAKSMEALVQRAEETRRLKIVFIGPTGAGKTMLANSLLGDAEPLLPSGFRVQQTQRVWRVQSCEGATAHVAADGAVIHSWSIDPSDPAAIALARAELAAYLLCASKEPGGELEVSLPLAMADPFGCPYCLVNTPGIRQGAQLEKGVGKYLSDSSFLVCIVCNVFEGRAAVEAMRSTAECARGRAFWVFTQLERLAKRSGGGRLGRLLAQRRLFGLRELLWKTDASAVVFALATQAPGAAARRAAAAQPHVARPPWAWGPDVRQRLQEDGDEEEEEEAEGACRLEDIRWHAKALFLEGQRRRGCLGGLSRRCVEAAADLISEYADLKDGSLGSSASERLSFELKLLAEEAASELERNVAAEVEELQGAALEQLCGRAVEAMRSRDGPQHFRSEALLRELVSALQQELSRRMAAAAARARNRVACSARRLLKETGLDDEGLLAPGGAFGVSSGDDDQQRSSGGPIDAFLALPATTGLALPASAAWCMDALGELPFYALQSKRSAQLFKVGLRLAAAGALRLVGIAATPLALLGMGVAKVAPFWRPAPEVEAKAAAAKLRTACCWAPLAEAETSRARTRLLCSVAQLRCSASLELLLRGAPRPALKRLFPELSLLEEVQRRVEVLCREVLDFVDAPDLAPGAGERWQQCRAAFRVGAWEHVAELTTPFAVPSARTDLVEAEALAGMLHMRCHALQLVGKPAEALEAAEAFARALPSLRAPALHRAGAQLLLRPVAGGAGEHAEAARRMDVQQLMARAPGSGPPALELWFSAVATSHLQCQQSLELLRTTSRCLIAEHMRNLRRPCLEEIAARVAGRLRRRAALFQELDLELLRYISSLGRSAEFLPSPPEGHVEARRASEEIGEAFTEDCRAYAQSTVHRLRELLGCLPPAHVDIHKVGRPVVDAFLEQVLLDLVGPPALRRSMELELRGLLSAAGCGLHDEWARLLGEVLRGGPPELASPPWSTSAFEEEWAELGLLTGRLPSLTGAFPVLSGAT